LALVAGDKFKVFISWSGELSKRVTRVWKDLVREAFDAVEPFMSEENIGAGERGLAKVANELSGTSFGIIVVTQENQASPWLNYEAGALSKDVDDETVRVAPALVDFARKSDVTGPLGQFQASLLNRDGVEYILLEIATVVGVDESSIKKRFNHAWRGEYEGKFAEAKTAGEEPPPARRSNDEMLDEVLTIVRELARTPSSASQAAESIATLSRRSIHSTKVREALSAALADEGEFVSRIEVLRGGKHRVIIKVKGSTSPDLRQRVTEALSPLDFVSDIGFEELTEFDLK
jgi:hypothetical protein